jgi:hypothetical protein
MSMREDSWLCIILAWSGHMFSTHCNIDKTDRINRTLIGLALCIAVLIGMGKFFFYDTWVGAGHRRCDWLVFYSLFDK